MNLPIDLPINLPINPPILQNQRVNENLNPISPYLDYNPQITFMKEVYKKYINCVTHKTKHNFEQNQFVIPISENLEAIHSIWIKNNSNIERVSLLVVSNEINMPINLSHEQNLNEEVSLTDILCRNEKTFLLTDLDQ